MINIEKYIDDKLLSVLRDDEKMEKFFENFDEVVTTNSIPLKEEMVSPKVKVLSLGPMVAGVIEHIVTGLPLSTVYDIYN